MDWNGKIIRGQLFEIRKDKFSFISGIHAGSV